jgi:tetratricopeptide (TPR) repeat protein
VYALYGTALFLQLFMLYYTATRGAQLGFVGGIFLAAAIIVGAGAYGYVRQKDMSAFVPKRILYASAGILAAVVLFIGVFVAVKDTAFVQESPVLSRFADMSLSGGTVASRLTIWGMAWEGVKERPVLGYGQGNFIYVFSKHYNAAEMYAQEPWFDRTHNIVFDWLIAGGFVGLLAYVSIFLAALYLLWISPGGRAAFDVTERAILTGLLGAYTAHNLTVFDNIVSYILFFTILAFIHQRATANASPLFAAKFSKEIPEKTGQTILAPVAIVATLAIVFLTNYSGIASAQTLLKSLVPQPAGPEATLELFRKALSYNTVGRQEVVEQLTQRAIGAARSNEVSEDTKQDFTTLAQESLEEQIARDPENARIRLFASGFYNRIGNREKALEHALKAYELSPTKQHVLFQLGEVYLNTGETDKALEIFRQAYEAAPEFDEARKLYAFAANYAGNFELSDRLLMEEYHTTAINEERFIRAYSDAKRYDVLEQIFTARIAENPDDMQARVSLAATYHELGNDARAIEVLEAAVAQKPDFKEQGEKFIEDIRTGNL